MVHRSRVASCWSGQDLSEAELSRRFRYRFTAESVVVVVVAAAALTLWLVNFPVTLREDGLSRGLPTYIYYSIGSLDIDSLGEIRRDEVFCSR